MRRPVKAAGALLISRVVMQELPVMTDVPRRRQFNPELKPDAIGAQFPVPSGLQRFSAIGVAVGIFLYFDSARERKEYILGLAVPLVSEVVKAWQRLPAIEHPDDSVALPIKRNLPPETIRAGKQFVVQLSRNDDDISVRFVILGVPRRAVT